jgi:hypothetical protein
MKRILVVFALAIALLGVSLAIQPASPAIAQTDMIRNGSFTNGMQHWQTWDAIQHRITSGVFEFYRTPGGSSAVVLQKTGQNLAAGAKLRATFQLGNADTLLNKRVTVIMHPDDWSELQACTFMLDRDPALETFEMEFFTTRTWTNATISFYASMDYNRGWIRVDNVTLRQDSSLPTNRVNCVDPNRPPTGTALDTGNFINNGDFSAGATDWGEAGAIVSRVQGGVYEYYTTTGGAAAVVLQDFIDNPNGDAIDMEQQGEARFWLGNSSSVRKRVSVIIHNVNFSNLSFCAFWLPPNTPSERYIMRFGNNGFGSSYRFISFYNAPADGIGWVSLDNISLRRRPGLTIVGTQCHYPGSNPAEEESAGLGAASSFALPTLMPTATGVPSFAPLPLPEAPAAPFSAAPEGDDHAIEGTISE